MSIISIICIMYEDFKKALTLKEERLRDKIQKEILSCYNCQPYDCGEPVWIHGERTDVEDLFYSFNIHEKYWDAILEYLFCPCGTELDTLDCQVGIQSKYEKDLNKFINDASKLYKKKIEIFINLLENTPFLGFKDSFGKKLYKEIETGKFPVTELNIDECYFRARKVNSHDILESSKMLNAPKGKPTEGRFNHSGQSYLYLTENKETAIKEVAQKDKSFLVWYQEFKLERKVEGVLDLTYDLDLISLSSNPLLIILFLTNSLEKFENNLDNWRPDYFITRFIMDCAKDLGYKGIKYNSTKSRNDFNIVLFYPHELELLKIGDPLIEIFKDEDREIFDF